MNVKISYTYFWETKDDRESCILPTHTSLDSKPGQDFRKLLSHTLFGQPRVAGNSANFLHTLFKNPCGGRIFNSSYTLMFWRASRSRIFVRDLVFVFGKRSVPGFSSET